MPCSAGAPNWSESHCLVDTEITTISTQIKHMTFKIIMALKTKIRLVGCKSCIVVYRYQCIRTCYRLYQVDKYSRCFQNVVTHLPKFIVSDCNLKKECQTFHCCAYRRMLVHSCYHHQQCYTNYSQLIKKKFVNLPKTFMQQRVLHCQKKAVSRTKNILFYSLHKSIVQNCHTIQSTKNVPLLW